MNRDQALQILDLKSHSGFKFFLEKLDELRDNLEKDVIDCSMSDKSIDEIRRFSGRLTGLHRVYSIVEGMFEFAQNSIKRPE